MNTRLSHREHKIKSWQERQVVEIGFAIVTGLLGLAIGLNQRNNPQGRGWLVPAMGFTVSALTLISPIIFTADSRTIGRARERAEPILEKLHDLSSTYAVPGQKDENKALIQADFLKSCGDFDKISLELLGEPPANQQEPNKAEILDPLFSESTVHAQSSSLPNKSVPDWISTNTSKDPSGTFFVGTSDGKSLSEAQTSSLDDAMKKASLSLSGNDSSKAAALLPILSRIATVTNTSLSYDETSGTYTYYVRIHVNNDIRSIPLGVSPANPPLNTVNEGHTTACIPALNIVERTYVPIKDHPFQGNIYVYVGDLHHSEKGDKISNLYVVVGSHALAYPENAKGSIRLKQRDFENLHIANSAKLSFYKAGASVDFEYAGAKYYLTVTAIHHPLGNGYENVDINICPSKSH
jgi:hypothetical protein